MDVEEEREDDGDERFRRVGVEEESEEEELEGVRIERVVEVEEEHKVTKE